ncbi:uncharacterized protein A4U43_C09F2560 [Asparagus officinalis]|uniref:Uncharacterized protein n=1 Tax=Asparagus officinalis TaxID=4686 RepID=A0A5P1E597_ASPOF|nr:uncharacterized protein LOC109824523 [Asparagus officinalis]ONK57639.1 uncharacterized protein A4U43_C09F2560 [Asparagus officinalis]
MNKIERKSSIEREPQTLSLDQIKYAREAALYVLSNHSIQEAISIFTEGLQPVLCVKKGNMNMIMERSEDEDGGNLDRIAGLRDTITAPF